MSELTLDEWRRLLNQLNKIAAGNAPEVLAVARDLAAEVPHNRVQDALADNALLETGTEYDTLPWESIRPDADNSEVPHHDSTDTQESGSDRSNSPEDIETPDENLGDVGSPLEACIARVADIEYLPTAVAREIWVNWILDGTGRKRPVAPWQTNHAYPVEWHANLAAADRPETDFDTANRWAEFPLSAAGLSLPDDAQSDGLETGIILPND